MRQFSLLLILAGIGCLIGALIIHIFSFNPMSAERFLAADGSFDGPVPWALQAIGSGVPLTGLLLIVFGLLFHFFERSPKSPLHWAQRTFILALIGFKLISGFIFITITPYKPFTDDRWFYEQAKNLSENKDPASPDGKPTASWPIGYSLFLAAIFKLFGQHVYAGQVFNVLIFTGIACLTYLLGRDLFGSIVARRSSLIIALAPSQLFYSLPLMSDPLLALLVLLLVYLAQKQATISNTLYLGICFGLAMLTKPVVAFFPLGILTYRLIRDHRWKPALLQIAVIFVIGEMIMVPWQIRNYRDYGQFVLVSTQVGMNLWMGNNPHTRGGTMDRREYIPKEIFKQMETMNEAQSDQLQFAEGRKWALSNPLWALSHWPKKFMHLFYEDSKCVNRAAHLSYKGISPLALCIMFGITEGYYYAIMLAFLIALIYFLKNERFTPRSWLILGTILYFILIHMPFQGEGRYHLPLMPLFAIIVALSLPGAQEEVEKQK